MLSNPKFDTYLKCHLLNSNLSTLINYPKRFWIPIAEIPYTHLHQHFVFDHSTKIVFNDTI